MGYIGQLYPNSLMKAGYAFDGNSNDRIGLNNGSDSSLSYDRTYSKIDQGVTFTSDASVVEVTDAAAIQNIFDGGGMVEMWFYPTTTVNDAGRLIDKGGDAGTVGWFIDTEDATGGMTALHFYQNFADGSQLQEKTPVNISINTKHHLRVIYDNSSTSNRFTVYIDGELVSLTLAATAPTGTRGSDVGQNLGIGERTTTKNVGYKGSLDELYLSKSTITASQAKRWQGWCTGRLM